MQWDIIGLNEAFSGGGHYDGARTDFSPRNLTFSEPVDNLFFAVNSMNSNGYKFDQNFEIVSQGPGKYGDSPDISPTDFGNGQYGITSGGEFNGVLKIDGSVDRLTWTSQNKEAWNGFTVGTYGQSPSATVAGNVLDNDTQGNQPPADVTEVNGTAMVGNSVTIELSGGATIKVDKDGDYLYDDNGAYASLGAGGSHTDTITYKITDANGNSDTATLTVTVNGANDAPLAVNDKATTDEGQVLTLAASTLLGNDSDPDTGDTISLSSVQGAVNGSVGIVNGAVEFTPDSDFHGAASFTYTIKDAAGLESTATVDVTVSELFEVEGNIIKNGSFESNPVDPQNGWNVQRIDWISTLWEPADGDYSIDLNAFDRGKIVQIVEVQAGEPHVLGFAMSKNPLRTDDAEVQVVIGPALERFTYSGNNTNSDMQWEQKSLSFTAHGGIGTILYPFEISSRVSTANGPAIDEVVLFRQQTITGFSKAESDVLDLTTLLDSVDAPHDNSAFTGGYLNFQSSGSDTLIQVDADGGGDGYLTVATLVGVSLTSSDVDYFNL